RRGADILSRQGYMAGAAPRTESPVPDRRALSIGWITFSTAPSDNQPAPDTRFDNSSPLFFSTEIYDRNLARKEGTAIALAYRVMDRNTGIEKYASGEAGLKESIRPGSPVIPFAARLRSESLKPGSYRLEVTVHDTSAPAYVVRTADFEIAEEQSSLR